MGQDAGDRLTLPGHRLHGAALPGLKRVHVHGPGPPARLAFAASAGALHVAGACWQSAVFVVGLGRCPASTPAFARVLRTTAWKGVTFMARWGGQARWEQITRSETTRDKGSSKQASQT